MLQPHAAVPLPLFVLEPRQVRRAPLRRADFEQSGYTDTCPGCANARAGRKQAVDHSEQCRSRMVAILLTTTEGHMRLERARERFALFAEEPRCDEVSAQETSPRGRREAASCATSINSVGVGVVLAAFRRCLQMCRLQKRSLEQETDMTDASVEEGERKRCKEHPTVPGSASSSCSSSGSESSTDTEMGLVDVCTILPENPETESCRGGQS